MRMNFLLLLLSVTYSIKCFAQAPAIQWQKCYGGTGFDQAVSVVQTSDGGYITAGQSSSADGDVSSNHGNFDYWVVKLQSNGVIEWQRSLGGLLGEQANCIRQTSDGGYIVAGYSNSNDGDVSGSHSPGVADYWIVRLTSSGAVPWEKCYGGSNEDKANAMAETPDGGYIIAGTTQSNDGDVSGNHGQQDCWVIKINSAGDLLWQKCYGGTATDVATNIQTTSEGGYIMCCQSVSDDGDLSSNHGLADYWIVKLNNAGNIMWQHSYGGSDVDIPTSIIESGEGYLVAGFTDSFDGDVTSSQGSTDVWIIRLDGQGELVWQKTYGGSQTETASGLRLTADGGFIIVGVTDSVNGDVTGQHGSSDVWIIGLNSQGTLVWQKTCGGTQHEGANSLSLTADGGFVLAGTTSSNNDGDVGANNGGYDYWVVKLSPEVLPVKLSNLAATADGGSVLCTWQTYQEQNSSRFVIERSSDGLQFTDAGNVAAAGNSPLPLNYQYPDKNAFDVPSTILYYRLRIVDIDGSFSYSNIATVKTSLQSSLDVYPNPAVDGLKVSFVSPQNFNGVIEITDAAGKRMLRQNKILKKGSIHFHSIFLH